MNEIGDFALRKGVSFCRVAGRTLFLDVVADRYLCLSPRGEAAFCRLSANGGHDETDRVVLDNLVRDGPLVRVPHGARIAPCPAIDRPTASLLDRDGPHPTAIDLAKAAWSVTAASIGVRVLGLQRALARLESRQARRPHAASEERITRVALAFAQLRFIATEHDNCLTRSLAVANRLSAMGIRARLVIAVKLQPFAAHAWVQCDDYLVNDRREFVREFTPILVV